MELPHQLSLAPFTAEQAIIAGVTKRQLSSMVSTGRVVRLLRSVYLDVALVTSLEARLDAVSLVLPEFGIVCDRTAAWLHGVETLEYQELELPPRLDVVVLRDHTRRRRSEVTARVRDLRTKEVMQMRSLHVTTPLRTAMDLGCQLKRRSALAALDQFAHHHDVTAAQIASQLHRFRGRRGVVQLRELSPLLEARAESPAESWVRMVMLDAGLPRPTVQHSILVDGTEKFRLDLAYPNHRVCTEYDGRDFHSDPADVDADARRRDWLRAAGWIVIVVTNEDWTAAAIDRWTGEIAAALYQRHRPRSLRRFALPRR